MDKGVPGAQQEAKNVEVRSWNISLEMSPLLKKIIRTFLTPRDAKTERKKVVIEVVQSMRKPIHMCVFPVLFHYLDCIRFGQTHYNNITTNCEGQYRTSRAHRTQDHTMRRGVQMGSLPQTDGL